MAGYIGGGTSSVILDVADANTFNVTGDLDVDGGTIKLDGNHPVGSGNVALGDQALQTNTTGIQNTAVGANAGATATAGYVTAFGYNAATAASSSYSTIVAIGAGALQANTTGIDNLAIGGYNTLGVNTTGSYNIAVGREALNANTTTSNNTAVGYRSLYSNTAHNNTAVGYNSLYLNTTGTNGVAIGAYALDANTAGSNNIAVGRDALGANTTGGDSVCVGYQAGYSGTTAGSNTFIGNYAGYSNTSGNNTYIGRNSGDQITSGSSNTIIGRYNGNAGGLDIRSSSNYIVLSDGDGNPRCYSNGGNWVLVPTNPYIASEGSSLYAFGRRSSSTGVILTHNATSWSGISDETRKDIIEDISDATTKVAGLRTVIGKFKTDDADTRRPFLIAQDVQAVLPEAVDTQEDDQGEYLVMSYTDMIPLLTAAIKELKAENDSLKARVEALENA